MARHRLIARSFGAEGDDGVDGGGAAGGEIAGEEGDNEKQRGDRDDCWDVA